MNNINDFNEPYKALIIIIKKIFYSAKRKERKVTNKKKIEEGKKRKEKKERFIFDCKIYVFITIFISNLILILMHSK